MKLFIITLFLLGSSVVTVSADQMVRFLFNNGITPPATQICSAADNAKIDAIFNPTVRRRLGNSSNMQRELPSAVYCKDNCRGFATGTCRATGCNGYRRELRDETSDRDLQLTCGDQILRINNALTKLITTNAVSSKCKTFLNPSRRLTSCYDDVVYGKIENLDLYEFIDNSPVTITDDMPTSGYTICQSTAFSVESKSNTCVDFIRFFMVGPNDYEYDHLEDNVPYVLFGNEPGGGPLFGQQLDTLGDYTLTITPDGFETKQRIIQFTVVEC